MWLRPSTARIFAKCLNCVEGPTTKPCNECDVCNAVSVGEDVDVLELADNTAWHILSWPELLGFCEPGQADWMLENGELDIDGTLAVNPSGGFISFGEATTAQAVLQICELSWQLRGRADGHQVRNARVGMSAVLGLGANGGSVILKV